MSGRGRGGFHLGAGREVYCDKCHELIVQDTRKNYMEAHPEEFICFACGIDDSCYCFYRCKICDKYFCTEDVNFGDNGVKSCLLCEVERQKCKLQHAEKRLEKRKKIYSLKK